MKRFLDDLCLSPLLLPSHAVDPVWGKSMAIMTDLLTEALNSVSWEQQQQQLIARASQNFNALANSQSTTVASSTGGLVRNASKALNAQSAGIPLEERIETTT